MIEKLNHIIEQAVPQLSLLKPSEWVEQNIVMGAPFPGPYRYNRTPYCREIIDCLSPDHPAKWIAVMKGAQIGMSAGVLIPGMGWIIKESPGNTYFTVGAPDIVDKSVEKLDLMIDNAGLRQYIRPQINRRKSQKSGDTNTKKDFAGGYINITTANNHKELRDVSLKYGFFDDFEAARKESKESGDTRKLLEQRFAAYADSHKIFYISTPELKETSNIEPAFLLGDQRKYLVPCPCCGEMIEWLWSVDAEGFTGGITWQTDDNGKLIKGSVGYTCQKCGGFFDDKRKGELLNAGVWTPTAEPSKEGYYSYHISSLYAPLGMYDWEHYVNDWIAIHPPNQPRKEAEYMTFRTVVLGQTYEPETQAPAANAIQRNTRNYDIGIIPEKLSLADGNGHIVLLTCGSDMNGVEDDARLDYEIVAHSETGATYSVTHGSIGSFIPRENTLAVKQDRERKTYNESAENNVWKEFEQILTRTFHTDTGREMRIAITGLDCGHYAPKAYWFIDNTNALNVVGVKGTKEDSFVKFGVDVRKFKPALERAKLYIAQVGLYKDQLAEYMQLYWRQGDMQQPAGFMNFPTPGGGLYGFQNFFEHFESETKKIIKNKDGTISSRWEKKTSTSQNHLWDCRVYNLVVRDILVDLISKEVKQKLVWADYVNILMGRH